MSNIMAQRMKLQQTIADAERKLFELQGACPHTDAIRHAWATNMDARGMRTPPRHGFSHYCPDCGKTWGLPPSLALESALKAE